MVRLSSNKKKGFLKTATTLISILICEDDRNKAESQDESKANELDNDPNNNQNDENLFERLYAYVEQYFTHSHPVHDI